MSYSEALNQLESLRRSLLFDSLPTRDVLSQLDDLTEILKRDSRSINANGRMSFDKNVIRSTKSFPNFNHSIALRSKEAAVFSPECLEGKECESQEESDESWTEEGGEEEEDEDDSFARLSYLLERSINEGQDALGTPLAMRTALKYHELPDTNPQSSTKRAEAGSPCIDSRVQRASNSCRGSPRTSRRARSTLVDVQKGFIMEHRDTHNEDKPSTAGETAMPPSYEEGSSPDGVMTPSTSPAHTIVDDGIAALESLIDQLATNTLAAPAESGLTSNRAFLVFSLLALVLSYIMSRHFGQFGVSCHCVCPAPTLTPAPVY